MKKILTSILIPCIMAPNLEVFPIMNNPKEVQEKRPKKINDDILTKEQVLEIEHQLFLAEQERIKAEEERQKREAELAEQYRKNNVGYNFYNLLQPSGITHSEMYSILADTGIQDVAWTIVQCEIDFGINAIVLASLIAEESGWGNSPRALYQNNLSGYAVFSDSSEGASFVSRDDSVVETARLLKYDYLTEGGQYHNGFSLSDVHTLYSANPNWANNISTISDELVAKYRNTAF